MPLSLPGCHFVEHVYNKLLEIPLSSNIEIFGCSAPTDFGTYYMTYADMTALTTTSAVDTGRLDRLCSLA